MISAGTAAVATLSSAVGAIKSGGTMVYAGGKASKAPGNGCIMPVWPGENNRCRGGWVPPPLFVSSPVSPGRNVKLIDSRPSRLLVNIPHKHATNTGHGQ
jgi:hypothetical protein